MNVRRKNLTSRRLTALFVSIALIGTMAACGGGGTGGDETGGATEISVWAYGPDVPVFDRYLDVFYQDHPDIKVIYKLISQDDYDAVLRPALASDAGPDIFMVEPGARFERYWQYGVDVGPAFEEALGADWQSKIAQIGIDGFSKDGKLMSAPVGNDTAGYLWANLDMFDAAGLTPPTTFDEWIEVCKAFKEQGQACFIQGAQQVPFDRDTFQAIANTIEPGLYYQAVLGQAQWTDPKLVQAFEAWGQMFTEGIMQDGALGITQYPDANNLFLAGQYAMVMMGSWYMQNTRADVISEGMQAAGNTGDPFTVVPIPFPAAPGGQQAGFFGNSAGGLSVAAKSKNVEAATTFVTWLGTSAAGQQVIADVMNNIPSLAGVEPQFDQLGLVNAELQKPALQWLFAESSIIAEPRALDSADLEEALGTALTTIAEGIATPADAAAKLQAAVEALG